MANQQSKNGKKQYFIPLELGEETIITREYRDKRPVWTKVGNRLVRAILVPVTKEQYEAFMRPLWREDKFQQRHGMYLQSTERVISSKDGDSYKEELESDFNLEETVLKEELLKALKKERDKLQKIDRIILDMVAEEYSEAKIGKAIGMSQKGVNKRKKKLFAALRKHLEPYK